ncbi:MAG: HmuY family protein [Bacteroidota bacterium]
MRKNILFGGIFTVAMLVFSTAGFSTMHLTYNIGSESGYTYYNLDFGLVFEDSASTNWDIGFNGTTIIVNSGVSGPGSAQAQVVLSDFESLMTAPSDGYMSDDAIGNAIPTGSGNGWYEYLGPPTHKIVPMTGRTILVKTNSGNYSKVKIVSYYRNNPDLDQYTQFPPSEASGIYTFMFFTQTDGSTNLDHQLEDIRVDNFDANQDNMAFFSFDEITNISYLDSATTNWDIAIKATTVLFNGGSSGPGTIAGQIVLDGFDNLSTPPSDGYEPDSPTGAIIPTGSGNGWYTYSGPPAHKIEVIPNRSFAFEKNGNEYYKLEFISYYAGNPDLEEWTASPPPFPARQYTFRYEKFASEVGLFEALEIEPLKVYPNPATHQDLVYVEFYADSPLAVISITDLKGKVVFNQQLNSATGFQKLPLTLSKLNTGLYIVKVQNAENVFVNKFYID